MEDPRGPIRQIEKVEENQNGGATLVTLRRGIYADPAIKTLSSGWTRIELGQQIWAQIPPGFAGETIPDEYIFKPEWSREFVNDWWVLKRSGKQ